MSTLVIVLLIAAVVIAGALLVWPKAGPGNGSLRRRFGPEYERTVARHNGDTKAARKDLTERLRRHGRLRVRPLAAGERAEYELKWARVQERFVESPGAALAEADHLLTRLLHDRGFPSGSRDERATALSVHLPRHVEAYRRAHGLAGRAETGDTATEESREAMLRARDLFQELLTAAPRQGDGPGTTAGRPRMRLPGRSPATPRDGA
jgi:hypothetical protein